MDIRICAGIVLYNPDIKRLKENIEAIVKQVQVVYLQDNGSSNIDEIINYINQKEGIILLNNTTNKGIAWALNHLCERGIADGYDWILTLDQDSVCPDGMISIYKKYLKNVDMLCPKIIDRNYGMIDGSSLETEEVKKCITSGCLLKLKSWEKLNGFDEKMFIDGVDFEFCYRMNQSNMKIIRANKVILYHEIGNISIRHFLCFKVIVKNHSAFRKYYMSRNIIYTAKKRKSKFLVVKGLLQEIKMIAIVLLYEKEKKEKSINILKGIMDGFR